MYCLRQRLQQGVPNYCTTGWGSKRADFAAELRGRVETDDFATVDVRELRCQDRSQSGRYVGKVAVLEGCGE